MNKVSKTFTYSDDKLKQRFAGLIEKKLLRIQQNEKGFEKGIREVELMINFFTKEN